MALPSLVKTWNTHNHNNRVAATGAVLTTNRNMWLAMKNGITGFATGAPTVYYSCDSVVAGAAGDAVDRWDTNTDLVWANAGSAHSWMVLAFPGMATNAQLLLSCEASSAQGAIMTIVWSPINAFTGGTTTARPTATGEIVVHSTTLSITSDADILWNASLSTDGKVLRFWTWSGGTFRGLFGVEVPRNPCGWTSPSTAYVVTTVPSAANMTTGALYNMRNTVTPVNITCTGTSEHNGTNFLSSVQTVADSDGNWPFYSVGTYCGTAGSIGEKGSLNDAYLGSASRVSADVYPSSGAAQWGHLGALILPVAAVPVLT